MMEVRRHDIVIIGGGGAGLRAAIAAGEQDPDLSVGLVSKVYPMRSHTVAAEGGAAGAVRPDDSFDQHIDDTISGSDWLADQDAVELFVHAAPRELTRLEHWGCPWSRMPDGSVAVRPFGGMKIERTWFAADKTGFHLLHTLFQTALKYTNLVRYDEHFAVELLVHDGRCQGVAVLELLTGRMFALAAPAVILCTGGGGRVYRFTTNAAIKTGDGMALAYRAGVPLKDMEFVQFHPTGLPGTGILITEAARGEGAVLVNKDGYRYLQDYELGKPLDVNDPQHPRKRTMELGPRDRLSLAFVKERARGRTIEGRYGDYVHLDLRHLGAKRIEQRLPFISDLCRNYVGLDPVKDLIPVRPVVHYMMGGIDTDLDGATRLPGLYAAGECACVSINGANRLGSNSLSELLVFGARAACAASTFSRQHGALATEEMKARAAAVERRIGERFARGGGETIAGLRQELNDALESGVAIERDEPGLRQACTAIAELKQRLERLRLSDASATFNTERTAALELEFMVDVAESVAHGALARTESRGAHQRRDFPRRDDQRFLKHSLAYRTDEAPRIEFRDVTITRWPPGVRHYGQ
jgi:fumarate reductase flavoprotein subunit